MFQALRMELRLSWPLTDSKTCLCWEVKKNPNTLVTASLTISWLSISLLVHLCLRRKLILELYTLKSTYLLLEDGNNFTPRSVRCTGLRVIDGLISLVYKMREKESLYVLSRTDTFTHSVTLQLGERDSDQLVETILAQARMASLQTVTEPNLTDIWNITLKGLISRS